MYSSWQRHRLGFLLALVLAAPLVMLTGCEQLRPLRETRLIPAPNSAQLGVSPTARSIEDRLGVE